MAWAPLSARYRSAVGGIVLAGLLAAGCGPGPGRRGSVPVCVRERQPLTTGRFEIIMLLDRSGSMSGMWDQTTNALNAFFTDPASAGINVGINMFPAPGTGYECTPTGYNPIQCIPQGLPGGAAVLGQVLDQGVGGATPMYGAFDGTYQAAIALKRALPDHTVVVVVSGDGQPNESDCDLVYPSVPFADFSNIERIAQFAGNALTSAGVQTYAVVLDPSARTVLDAVAAAGGTGQAFDISANVSEFTARMAQIRDSVAVDPCLFSLPALRSNDPIDLNRVNIEYVSLGDGGSKPTYLPRVADSASCDSRPGWYVDTATQPASLVLCPLACAWVGTTSWSFVYGCETVTE